MTIRVFIICCHTTPHTKGGVLAEAITGALERVGIAYRLSDLAASRFNPIAGPLDFLPTLPFQPSYRASQKLAVRCDGFATDIRIEQDNLMWADHVVFIFPIWFFGMPAVLKVGSRGYWPAVSRMAVPWNTAPAVWLARLSTP